jgi:hypothetical protein
MDSLDATGDEVLASDGMPVYGLPVFGAPHPSDSGCTVSRIAPEQIPDGLGLWKVEVEWSSGDNDPENQKKPDQRAVEISSSFVQVPKVFFKDLDDKPFHDTADTPFDPPPQIACYAQKITYSRYETTADFEADRQFVGATNDAEFEGAEQYHAMVENISRRRVFMEDDYYWQTTYEILYNPHTAFHPLEILSCGPRYKDNAGKILTVKDAIGVIHGGKALLDANGKLLAAGADPHYIEFAVHKTADFSELNIH